MRQPSLRLGGALAGAQAPAGFPGFWFSEPRFRSVSLLFHVSRPRFRLAFAFPDRDFARQRRFSDCF